MKEYLRILSLIVIPIILPAGPLNADEPAKAAEAATAAGKALSSVEAAAPPAIVWQDWSADIFKRAQKENRFVILDLESVWCHWCHVMDETTYRDAKVRALIESRYLPVRVDQDAHPDLSNRYEDYGWPATIVFGPDGKEIVKRRGYMPPELMASLLQAIIDDPTPGPSVLPEIVITPSEKSLLTEEQTAHLLKEHADFYDEVNGGWGDIHKLIDPDNLEYALMRGRSGDKKEEAMAVKTLDAALNLLDREWGGFFQYSDKPDWKSPHYEKIMSIQSQYIRLYALAYEVWGKPEYLAAARKTAEYIRNFLTAPDGSFYTSQDADISPEKPGADFYSKSDAERRKGEMPAIDKSIYARENGWMISSLCALYEATGEQSYLDQARRSADVMIKTRNLPGGGFRHNEKDAAGPYLGDTLAMAEAFLHLYKATAERKWLALAEESVSFIEKTFKHQEAGYVTSADAQSAFESPVRQVDENISLARLTNLLGHYSGRKEHHESAQYTMRFLASPGIVDNRHFLTGILIVDQELRSDPTHIVVVAAKDDNEAKALYLSGLRYPAVYKRIEWWDKKEGPLPNPDVTYPDLGKAAAFACSNGTCSFPVFKPEKLAAQVDRLNSKRNTD